MTYTNVGTPFIVRWWRDRWFLQDMPVSRDDASCYDLNFLFFRWTYPRWNATRNMER